MITIKGHNFDYLPIPNLNWKRDLLYFEGPLLSEYEDESNNIYLKYWCDCDSDSNRWMLFKINEKDRLRLVLGEKSIHSVITESQEVFVFIIDESETNESITLVEKSKIPSDYIPSEKSFLNIQDYTEDKNILSFIFENNWDIGDFKLIFNRFVQLYDFVYFSKILTKQFTSSFPWKDGFSSMHFYSKLKDQIPREDHGVLNAIQYASPGYMKIQLNDEVSDTTLESIKKFIKNKTEATTSYHLLSGRIRELQLNQDNINSISIFDGDSQCMSYYSTLALSLTIDKQSLNNLAKNNFERCKIIMAHYRRISEFTDYVQESKIRIVNKIMAKT